MKLRGCDNYGCGHYGASRGNRTHNGVDIVCAPGEAVFCFHPGVVTDIGYAYADDLSFRIVDITSGGMRYRYFYVDPIVNVGDELDAYTQIGWQQTLLDRYPNGMTDHVHFEAIRNGGHIDPSPLVSE